MAGCVIPDNTRHSGGPLKAFGATVLVVAFACLVVAQTAAAQTRALLEKLDRSTEIVQGDGLVVAANQVDVSNVITSIVTAIRFLPKSFGSVACAQQ